MRIETIPHKLLIILIFINYKIQYFSNVNIIKNVKRKDRNHKRLIYTVRR